MAERDAESIAVFTGNPRYFPVEAEDLSTLCEEWVGPGLFAEDLKEAAIAHMGGTGTEAVAVTNRTSAGIVAAVLALSEGRPVVSVVPDGDRSHASVVRGCGLAKVPLVEVQAHDEAGPAMAKHEPRLVVVTTVTSTLARLEDVVSRNAISAAKAAGATVLLDEAYGARIRPILHDGTASLALGADLAITNTDKAGLSGPRAGVLAGQSAALVAVLANASELGMEARAPIAAGAMQALRAFDPETLREEARDGQRIADALTSRFGEALVARSDLGPMLDEQDVLALLLERAGAGPDIAGPGRGDGGGRHAPAPRPRHPHHQHPWPARRPRLPPLQADVRCLGPRRRGRGLGRKPRRGNGRGQRPSDRTGLD